MTGLIDLELQPFELKDVPSELEWCVYPEERKLGKILLPETVYMTVLALRWILSSTREGDEGNFETWKVYWKNEDKYGFMTRIYLFKDRVEQYQYNIWDDTYEDVLLQEQVLYPLATLKCSDGQGIITNVNLSSGLYGNLSCDGDEGVRRMLRDASLASEATYDSSDCMKRRYDQEAHDCRLAFKLKPAVSEYGYSYGVASVELMVDKYEEWGW